MGTVMDLYLHRRRQVVQCPKHPHRLRLRRKLVSIRASRGTRWLIAAGRFRSPCVLRPEQPVTLRPGSGNIWLGRRHTPNAVCSSVGEDRGLYTQRTTSGCERVFMRSSDFFGKPVGTDAAQKSVFGFFAGRDMIGCADVIRSYPTDDCIWIGLMLVTEANQGRGYGKAALNLLIEMAIEWSYRTAQLAVVSTNPRAYAFWQREGFEEIRRATSPRFNGDLIVMQRLIQ